MTGTAAIIGGGRAGSKVENLRREARSGVEGVVTRAESCALRRGMCG
jgi:hypothetical protein